MKDDLKKIKNGRQTKEINFKKGRRPQKKEEEKKGRLPQKKSFLDSS